MPSRFLVVLLFVGICLVASRALPDAPIKDGENCSDSSVEDDSIRLLQSSRVRVERVMTDEHDSSSSFEVPEQHVAAGPDLAMGKAREMSKTSLWSLITVAGGKIKQKFSQMSSVSYALRMLFICLGSVLLIILCLVMYDTVDRKSSNQRPDGTRQATYNAQRGALTWPSPAGRVTLSPSFAKDTNLSPARNNAALLSAAPVTAMPVAAPSTIPRSNFGAHHASQETNGSSQPVSQMASFPAPRPPVLAYPALSGAAATQPSGKSDLGVLSTSTMAQQLQSVKSEGMPSPICPSLILPSCESRFAIPMSEIHALSGAEGVLNVSGGVSGTILLRASVLSDGGGRRLEISTPASGAEARASIRHSQSPERPGGTSNNLLEIRGFKGAYYGLLEIRSVGPCVVTRQGMQVMTIDGDPEELELWITSASGIRLASGRCAQELGGVDFVDIRVQPGMDTVLAIVCILAVLLFCPS